MRCLYWMLGFTLLFLGGCDDTLFNDVSCAAVEYEATWEDVALFIEAECQVCHTEAGLAEFSLEEAIEDDLADGADYLVIPGDSEGSLLWQVLAHEGEVVMPPSGGPLPLCVYEHVGDWIDAGAVIP